MTHLLFAYGTLAPVNADQAQPEGWQEDAIRGKLYSLGSFPGLFDMDDAEAGWVEGFVRPTTLSELEGDLDPYEGVAEGLFSRVQRTTRNGRHVWVYVYARARPEYAKGPITCWNGRRRPPNLRRAASMTDDTDDSIEETNHG